MTDIVNEQMHIMCDGETTSLDPATGALIQIGAVVFDPFNPNKEFVGAVPPWFSATIYPGFPVPWDPSTLKFHEEHDTSSWRYIQDMEAGIQEADPKVTSAALRDQTEDCLLAFAGWIYSVKEANNFGQIVFWSKPSHFDFNWFQTAFSKAGIISPFHYRHVMDMRSFIAGLQAPQEAVLPEIQFEGEVHEAIDDAMNQVRVVHKAVIQAAEVPYMDEGSIPD